MIYTSGLSHMRVSKSRDSEFVELRPTFELEIRQITSPREASNCSATMSDSSIDCGCGPKSVTEFCTSRYRISYRRRRIKPPRPSADKDITTSAFISASRTFTKESISNTAAKTPERCPTTLRQFLTLQFHTRHCLCRPHKQPCSYWTIRISSVAASQTKKSAPGF